MFLSLRIVGLGSIGPHNSIWSLISGSGICSHIPLIRKDLALLVHRSLGLKPVVVLGEKRPNGRARCSASKELFGRFHFLLDKV
jgi:hypothetical protein